MISAVPQLAHYSTHASFVHYSERTSFLSYDQETVEILLWTSCLSIYVVRLRPKFFIASLRYTLVHIAKLIRLRQNIAIRRSIRFRFSEWALGLWRNGENVFGLFMHLVLQNSNSMYSLVQVQSTGRLLATYRLVRV